MPKYKVKDSHTDYPQNVDITKKVAENKWGRKIQYIEVCNYDFSDGSTPISKGTINIAFVHGYPEIFTDINMLP